MAIQLDWIPYGGSNSTGQYIDRSDVGTIVNLGSSVNTYTDTNASPNTLYEYVVYNECLVGGPNPSNNVIGISWECPTITITEKQGSFSVDCLDALQYGYYYSIDLYDITNTNLEAMGDPFSPTQDPVSQIFSGLSSGTYYTVRVTIIAQDSNGQPDGTFTYLHECTEQGYVGVPASCPNATSVTANPQY